MRIAAVLLLLMCAAGAAEAKTGNQALEQCQESASAVAQAVCLGFITGVNETYYGLVPQELYCIPKGATYKQLTKIFVRHLETSPADLHQGAAFLLVRALAEAFPCATKSSGK